MENTEYVYKYYVNDSCKFECTVLLDVYIFPVKVKKSEIVG